MLQPKDTNWLNGYKYKTHICCLQETHFRPKDTYRLKVRKLIFSDHKAMRLDINYKKKKTVKNTNTWRLNNTFLNNQQITWRNQKGNQTISRNKWQWKHDNPKPMGYSKRSSKREVSGNTILPQETRKTLNRQPNFTPKTGKRGTQKPQN